MKKPYHFTDRDNSVRCIDCDRPLKKNVLERKDAQGGTRPIRCYLCHCIFESGRGHAMQIHYPKGVQL